MKGKSIKGKSPEEIGAALQQSMTDGFMPTLAIVFISIKQDRKAVCEILHQAGIDILGATSSGEFINGHQSEGEIVIMLLDLNKNDFCILFEDIGERSLTEAATHLSNAALQKFKNTLPISCGRIFIFSSDESKSVLIVALKDLSFALNP